MNINNLKKILIQCAEDCIKIGISPDEDYYKVEDIRINNRLKRTAGRCLYYTNGTSIIEISGNALKHPEIVRNVIMHEFLHALCPRDNHSGRWKKYAERVNTAYGYDVQTYLTGESAEKMNAEARYRIECTACGIHTGIHRKMKMFEHLNKCTCKNGHTHTLKVTDTKTGKVWN